MKAYNAATSKRKNEAGSAKYRFRELPIRGHHVPLDEEIERQYIQVHTNPLVPEEMALEPVHMTAVDGYNNEYLLSEGGTDSEASLFDANEEEFPDWDVTSND